MYIEYKKDHPVGVKYGTFASIRDKDANRLIEQGYAKEAKKEDFDTFVELSRSNKGDIQKASKAIIVKKGKDARRNANARIVEGAKKEEPKKIGLSEDKQSKESKEKESGILEKKAKANKKTRSAAGIKGKK